MNIRLGHAVSLVFLISLASLLAGAAPALADDAADAKTHYQKATAHYAVGEYREAAAAYESAYKAKQDPALLYNAAQSHRLAGDNQKALLLYKNIVKLHPGSKYAVESKDRIEKLEQAIATTQSPPNGTAPVEGGGTVAPSPAVAAPALGSPPAAGAPVQPIGQPAPGAAAPPAATPPVASASAPASTLTASSPPPADSTPIYQKWWFWAGGIAVIGAVAITAIALSGDGGGAWSNVPDVHGEVRP